MSRWRLVTRSLAHHWRAHVGVLLGVACAAAVLVGALVVGDSVRGSLREQALQRVGSFASVLASGDRFVTDALAGRIAAEVDAVVCPVLMLPGVANRSQGGARAGIVDVFGVDDGFFAMSAGGARRPPPPAGHALLNRRIAAQLDARVGDEVVLRVEKPSLMPQEATMATVDDVAFALRVVVDGIVDDDAFGRFGLRASQVPPSDVFVSRAWLAAELDLAGRVNLLLTDAGVAAADAALRARWQLADAELELREQETSCELRSDRVFLDAASVDAAAALAPDGLGVFTYFVNAIEAKGRVTPYSMVCGLGPLAAGHEVAPALLELAALAPKDDDELVANSWLSEDLALREGDATALSYFVMSDQLRLDEARRELRAGRVVPLRGAADDASLMPAFPGLAEARSCTDWEPGVPVQLDALDDADQAYWDRHRGTPKAFVTLATARALWANRFGTLTSIRAPSAAAAALRDQLPRTLLPQDLGLYFQDLRGPALAAAAPATDFGSLYLGLSFFLIAAALLLAALLFVFGLERRSGEVGALLAIGFEPGHVRRLFGTEASLLAVVGSLAGALAGVGYAQAVLAGLDSLWRDTVGQATLTAHVAPGTLALGAVAVVIASLAASWWTLRRVARRPAVELLATRGEPEALAPRTAGRRLKTSAILAALCTGGAVWTVAGAPPARATSAFFAGGALVLLAGLFACRAALAHLGAARGRPIRSVTSLALRGAGRRPGRSLATVALLASGAFLVLAIQANRLAPPRDPALRASGTGGFALFGRSTLPVLRDLGTEAARDAYALDEQDLEGVDVVPLRVRPGDDASCQNLATAQNPQLVGVAPAPLAERGAFRFTRTFDGRDGSWRLLDLDLGPGVVPAIGDGGSVTWALHKQVGDALRYRDERGAEFDVRIVATVADSILQGNLLIADRHMRARFPSSSGFRMFLVDAPPARAEAVAADLSDALADVGLELTATGERLAAFQSVQNTYLSIFQLLGGLGMLLGTVGLGVVVLRNAWERRGELAIARAVGFSERDVRRLLWREHALLLGLGLTTGLVAALVAVSPALQQGRPLPLAASAGWLVLLAASGAAWVWIASCISLRGGLLDRLRGE